MGLTFKMRQTRPCIDRGARDHRNLACTAGYPATRHVATTMSIILAAIANIGTATAGPAPPAPIHKATSLVHSVAVFERDDRRLISDRYPELRARIGVLIHATTQSVCTAFCVAPDIIATAGHCVAGTTVQPAGDSALLRFRRDTATGPGIPILGADRATAQHYIMTGSQRLSTRPPINATSDWAFLRLAKTACPAGGLPLTRRSAADIANDAAAGRVYHVAYHRDLVQWKLAVGGPCSFVPFQKAGDPEQLSRDFEHAEQLLLHTCDTEAASSGSPLLVEGEHGPEVVGINVGTYVRSRIITLGDQVVQRLDSEVVANTALVAAPLIVPLQAFASGQLLTDEKEIGQLQGFLTAQGLAPGPLDGQYGPQTRQAIEAYETRAGLPITGLATRSLLKRLETTTSANAAR